MLCTTSCPGPTNVFIAKPYYFFSVYSSRINDSTVMDRVVYDLGRLGNHGGFPVSLDPDANKIKFEIVTEVSRGLLFS